MHQLLTSSGEAMEDMQGTVDVDGVQELELMSISRAWPWFA